MSAWAISRVVWYVGVIGLVFLPIELMSKDVFGVAPWFSLSGTVEHDAHDYTWFMLLLASVAVGVTVHWLFGQRLWPSIAVAFSWALSAHLLDNKWP